MKRTRHISVEIEQRRFLFTLTRGEPAATGDASPFTPSGREPDVCPQCSSPWIAVTVQTSEPENSREPTFIRALQQRGLHLHCSPSGQLRICRRSLEEARFDEPKESL